MEKQNVDEFKKELRNSHQILSLFDYRMVDLDEEDIAEYIKNLIEQLPILKTIDIDKISNFNDFYNKCIEIIHKIFSEFFEKMDIKLSPRELLLMNKYSKDKNFLVNLFKIIKNKASIIERKLQEFGLNSIDLSSERLDENTLNSLFQMYGGYTSKKQENEDNIKQANEHIKRINELHTNANEYITDAKDAADSSDARQICLDIQRIETEAQRIIDELKKLRDAALVNKELFEQKYTEALDFKQKIEEIKNMSWNIYSDKKNVEEHPVQEMQTMISDFFSRKINAIGNFFGTIKNGIVSVFKFIVSIPRNLITLIKENIVPILIGAGVLTIFGTVGLIVGVNYGLAFGITTPIIAAIGGATVIASVYQISKKILTKLAEIVTGTKYNNKIKIKQKKLEKKTGPFVKKLIQLKDEGEIDQEEFTALINNINAANESGKSRKVKNVKKCYNRTRRLKRKISKDKRKGIIDPKHHDALIENIDDIENAMIDTHKKDKKYSKLKKLEKYYKKARRKERKLKKKAKKGKITEIEANSIQEQIIEAEEDMDYKELRRIKINSKQAAQLGIVEPEDTKLVGFEHPDPENTINADPQGFEHPNDTQKEQRYVDPDERQISANNKPKPEPKPEPEPKKQKPAKKQKPKNPKTEKKEKPENPKPEKKKPENKEKPENPKPEKKKPENKEKPKKPKTAEDKIQQKYTDKMEKFKTMIGSNRDSLQILGFVGIDEYENLIKKAESAKSVSEKINYSRKLSERIDRINDRKREIELLLYDRISLLLNYATLNDEQKQTLVVYQNIITGKDTRSCNINNLAIIKQQVDKLSKKEMGSRM